MYEKTPLPFDQVLMDGIQDMVFIMRVGENSIFYYDFLNRAAMERTGLTQDVLGKSIRDVNPQKTANFLYEQYNKVVTSGESIIYEDSYNSSKGGKYYSQTKLTPLFDETKKCSHIVALVQDITDKKRADLKAEEYWDKLNESRQRYQSLFYYNTDAILLLDLQGRIIDGNDAVENVTGFTPNNLIHSYFISLIIPTDVDVTKKYFQQALGGNAVNDQIAIHKKTGERIELMMNFTPIIINKEVVGIYSILKDVTEFVTVTKKLMENEQKFRIITEYAQDLITLLDDKGKIIYVSPSYKEILGFSHIEYVEKLFFHNVYPDDINSLEKVLSQSMGTNQPFTLQLRQRHKTKGWIWTELHGTPVFDDQNRFLYMVVLTRDITLRKEYELKLKYFAYHDSLTELPNRRLFKENLIHALGNFQEKEDGLAIIMMDIDYFKSINDQMGHDVGDMVIAEFGKRVRENIRENDTVARLGGDEFAILLPSIESVDNACAIAERIQTAMQAPWLIENSALKVTTSMGIAMAPFQGAATVYSMLKRADQALYDAKESGRNTYKIKGH